MFCLNCGKEIPDNSAVCQFCGVAQPQAQQTPPQTPPQAPQQTFEQAPQQAPYSAPQQAPYGAPQQTPYGAPQQQAFPSFAPPAPAKKKNKTPLIIGIVVGVIILLAIIGAIAGSSDSPTDEGNAPVETFGEYDINIESIPDDAVGIADSSMEGSEFHTLEKKEANGLIRHTYYCDGDEILGWIQEVEVDISTYSQEEIDNFTAELENEYQSLYASYSFIEHEVTIIGDDLIQTYTFTDIDEHLEDLKTLGLVDGGIITLYLSYEQTAANWIAQGYTEVEE